MPTEIASWVEIVKNGGLALAVIVLILGGMRQWYYWPWYVAELRRERDAYKKIAETGTVLSERGVRVAESVLNK